MEVPGLLIMGIFVAVLVLTGIMFTVSEFKKMNASGDQESDEDEDEYKP
ncbi:MAG: hypothetical protein WD037_12595 [Balneolales bacterium]